MCLMHLGNTNGGNYRPFKDTCKIMHKGTGKCPTELKNASSYQIACMNKPTHAIGSTCPIHILKGLKLLMDICNRYMKGEITSSSSNYFFLKMYIFINVYLCICMFIIVWKQRLSILFENTAIM